jgi:hypothetical protein
VESTAVQSREAMKIPTLAIVLFAALRLSAQPILHLDSCAPNITKVFGQEVTQVTITVSNAAVGASDYLYFSATNTTMTGAVTNTWHFQDFVSPVTAPTYQFVEYVPGDFTNGFFTLREAR